MEILPGVHVLPGVRWSRAYLIVGDTLTLVDSGLFWSRRPIVKYIRSIGRRPDELRHILLTHSHPDHTGATPSLVKATGATVLAHRSDTSRLPDNGLALGYATALGRLASPLPLFRRGARVNALVEDGDVLPIHGGIRTIHTPGHTGGSVCFLMEENGTLFSGDTIFSDGRRLSRSVPFSGYDRDSYVRSLERLSGFGFEAVCGGHGAPLPKGGGRLLRRLLDAHPEPPTWRDFFASLPTRMRRHLPVTGEYHNH